MSLIEDSARVLLVYRAVVRHDAVKFEKPAYLKDLVEDVTTGLGFARMN